MSLTNNTGEESSRLESTRDPVEERQGTDVERNDDHDDLYASQEEALSPTDGYFHSSRPSDHGLRQGLGLDNWVEDSSLPYESTADSKAREAALERWGRPGDQPSTPQTQVHSREPSSTSSIQSAPTSSMSPLTQPPHTESRYTPPSASFSGHNRGAYSERSVLIPPSEAPPAYTPSPTSTASSDSPTSPASANQSSWSRNYSTFSPPRMGRQAEESRGLLAHHRQYQQQPESMADNAYGGTDDDVEAAPTRSESIIRRVCGSSSPSRVCRMTLLVLVLLCLTTGFLITLISPSTLESDNRGNKHPESRPGRPNMDSSPQNYPPFDGRLVLSDSICRGGKHDYPDAEFPIQFTAGRALTIRQELEERQERGQTVHVKGDVVLRQSTTDKSSTVTVKMISNDDRISPTIDWSDDSSQTLVITTPPDIIWNEARGRPCLTIRVTVWVPKEANIDSLHIRTTHLGVKLLDNLSLRVSNAATIHTVVGHVVSATTGSDDNEQVIRNGAPDFFVFDSRSIQVKTTSAPITGAWPLYDLLHLQSTSGTIAVGVDPKPISKKTPKPAVFEIQSTSGSVQAWQPIKKAQEAISAAEDVIPPRDYRIDIDTTSGTIRGSLAFTSLATFHSFSGGIDMDLLPVLPDSLARLDAKAVDLQTTTTSGTTKVTVLEAMWFDGNNRFVTEETPKDITFEPIGNRDPYNIGPDSVFHGQRRSALLRVMNSKHTTTSASMSLSYPASWEGDINMEALSGKLSATGKGLRVIKDGSEWPGVKNVLVARKGDLVEGEGGRLFVKSLSGTSRVDFPT